MEQNGTIRRRKTKRYGRSGSVTLRPGLSAPQVAGSLFDLSLGGCLVWANECCRFDPSELIEVKLQSDQLTLRIMGSVRHISEAGRLLGIEFKRLNAKDTHDLEQLILQLEAATDDEHALNYS